MNNPVETDLKSITQARRVVDGMLWAIAAGAILFSLMTGQPLVADHSRWKWTGWALPAVVDAALVLSLSADSILSRHGVKSGKWATAFRWITALASLFLNTWYSIAAGDWVGVAVHSIAPVVLVCAAEVSPVYRRKFREVELNLSAQVKEITVTRVVTKQKSSSTEPAVVESSEPLTGRQQAIKNGFLAGKKAGAVAKEIGISPSYVYTQYRKIRDELGTAA